MHMFVMHILLRSFRTIDTLFLHLVYWIVICVFNLCLVILTSFIHISFSSMHLLDKQSEVDKSKVFRPEITSQGIKRCAKIPTKKLICSALDLSKMLRLKSLIGNWLNNLNSSIIYGLLAVRKLKKRNFLCYYYNLSDIFFDVFLKAKLFYRQGL